MIRRPPRSTPLYSSAASDVYKRQGMFNSRQSSCVDYVDDEALPSPQFFQMHCSAQDYVGRSLADISSPSAADFEPLSKTFIIQSCSQSCPDVSDECATSAAHVQPCIYPTAACFEGLNNCYLLYYYYTTGASFSTQTTLLLLLQPFYDSLSGTTQVSRYQKDKTFWILPKQR